LEVKGILLVVLFDCLKRFPTTKKCYSLSYLMRCFKNYIRNWLQACSSNEESDLM